MTARILDGKRIADELLDSVAARVQARVARGKRVPGLAVVLVGEDPASSVYVRNKRRACARVGFRSLDFDLPATTTEAERRALIDRLNADDSVHGILVQLPLPPGINGTTIIDCIDPRKDVDGFQAVNVGRLALRQRGLRPCTPKGVMELLDRTGVELEGRNAVVVGRSDIVGKPVALLLLHRSATVTICHSRTRDLPGVTRSADILIAAVGRPEMITGDMVKPGATVIDVGVNRTDDGLRGDVHFASASEVAGAITPVPGGVGPMTIAMLLRNTVNAATARRTA